MNSEIPPAEEQPVEEETKRQFDTMGDALRAGKDEGSAKAREAAPGLKSCVAEAFHDLAYGAFFTGSFANELVPKTVKSGLAKGAEAGKAAARKAHEKASEAFSPSVEEDVVELIEEGSTIPQTI